MSAPVQLTFKGLFSDEDAAIHDDIDSRRAARRSDMLRDLALYCGGRPDTYMDRWRWACLRADEVCPGCGYAFNGAAYDASRMHSISTGSSIHGPVFGPACCDYLIWRNRSEVCA